MNTINERIIARILKHIPLTLKMLMTTVVIGFAAWAVLDYFQTRSIKRIVDIHEAERLEKEAKDNMRLFEQYVNAHDTAAGVIVSQKRFSDFVAGVINGKWLSAANGTTAPIKYYHESPPWFPVDPGLRSLVELHYAFLLDNTGRIREVYIDHGPAPSQFLLDQSRRLMDLSSEKNIMTGIEGLPYVVSTRSLYGANKNLMAALMIACPVDDDFLRLSLGPRSPEEIVAIINAETSRIIASNKPELLHAGVTTGSLLENYYVAGRTSLNSGGPGLQVEFTSFIPGKDHELPGESILAAERRNRALTAVFLMVSFSVIGMWTTRRIKNLTDRVVTSSREHLGIELEESAYVDQMDALEMQFQRLTEEIVLSRDSLLEEKRNLEVTHEEQIIKNWEIDGNRKKLQSALDEISSLIREASHGKGFKVRSINHISGSCYDLLLCDKNTCPCYGRKSVKCWEAAGTQCNEHLAEKIGDRYEVCAKCPVFREISSDPVYQIGEHFNNMMQILENTNKELEKAYEELKSTQSRILQQEKMASIGQLAAGVAHEINNPIGFITSNLGTLGKYIGKFTEYIQAQDGVIGKFGTAEETEALKAIRMKLKLEYIMEDVNALIKESLDGAGRVKTIVQDLKTFSRVDGSMYKHADINECIESTLNIVWNELKYKTTVKKEYGDIPVTKCYPQQLNQVFMNLLVNAAQAIEKQGEVAIRTWNGDGSIYVAFSDTGCGIPEDKMGRIFEPFFTTKEVGKGTGLGLSITYDIIKKHNGEIMVDSEVGKGTTFTLKIPVVEGR